MWKRFLRRVVTGRPVVSASVGKPVDLARFRGAEPTSAVLREMTDLIMGAVRDEVALLRGEPAPTSFFVPDRRRVDKTRQP